MKKTVVWFEIYVEDMVRATKFYETVLDTKLEQLNDPNDSGVEMMSFPGDMEKYGAGGTLAKMEGMKPGAGGTLVYFGCDDCAVEESRVVAAGGKIVATKMSIGQHGFISLCVDTEGNQFGLHSM